jgi:hypothetical protein
MNMNQLKRIGIILFMWICLAVSQVATATTISVQPASVNKSVGETFSLDIRISDVTDLYAFQFDIEFDPSILSATSITDGEFLPIADSLGFFTLGINNVVGSIGYITNTLTGTIPGVSNSGVLASIDFKAIGIGTSDVSLSNVMLLDSSLNEITTTESLGSNVTVQGSLNPVPEPSTVLMIGIGMVCLSGLGRKKFRK